jgi:hypothetical protein
LGACRASLFVTTPFVVTRQSNVQQQLKAGAPPAPAFSCNKIKDIKTKKEESWAEEATPKKGDYPQLDSQPKERA